MPIRLTLMCSEATLALRKGSFSAEEPLDRQSHLQARRMRKVLRRADRVWTIPALRARQMAQALGLATPLSRRSTNRIWGDGRARGLKRC